MFTLPIIENKFCKYWSSGMVFYLKELQLWETAEQNELELKKVRRQCVSAHRSEEAIEGRPS